MMRIKVSLAWWMSLSAVFAAQMLFMIISAFIVIGAFVFVGYFTLVMMVTGAIVGGVVFLVSRAIAVNKVGSFAIIILGWALVVPLTASVFVLLADSSMSRNELWSLFGFWCSRAVPGAVLGVSVASAILSVLAHRQKRNLNEA